ncbi:hypothetical protein STENM327S_07296 [Streptomyces tendae]
MPNFTPVTATGPGVRVGGVEGGDLALAVGDVAVVLDLLPDGGDPLGLGDRLPVGGRLALARPVEVALPAPWRPGRAGARSGRGCPRSPACPAVRRSRGRRCWRPRWSWRCVRRRGRWGSSRCCRCGTAPGPGPAGLEAPAAVPRTVADGRAGTQVAAEGGAVADQPGRELREQLRQQRTLPSRRRSISVTSAPPRSRRGRTRPGGPAVRAAGRPRSRCRPADPDVDLDTPVGAARDDHRVGPLAQQPQGLGQGVLLRRKALPSWRYSVATGAGGSCCGAGPSGPRRWACRRRTRRRGWAGSRCSGTDCR